MSVPQIVLERVGKRFGAGVPAVDSLSLSIEPGETFALFGPSGCGKTTTLRLIAGFERPDEGRIRLGSRIVADDGVDVAPEDRRLGFVFQDYALFPHLTVEGNIGFGLRGVGSREKAARIREVLELSKLEGLGHRFPHELSGGQQQRVAVARALAPDFPVVLLDEPLSNLDASLRGSLRAELHRILKASGKTVLLVTHDREEAFEMADRIGVMSGGRLQQVGAPEDLHRRPATEEVARLVCDACFLPVRRSGNCLRTEIGDLPLGDQVPDGEELVLLVRENEVSLSRDDSGEGVVEKRVFRGPGHVIHVRLPSGASIRSRRDPDPDVAVGERVRVRLEPRDIVVLPGNLGRG
jgi:iron(III) transport system ATP-binding protein